MDQSALVREVREKEQLVMSSPQHANGLLWLMKALQEERGGEEESENHKVSIAAMHSLRRIFAKMLINEAEEEQGAGSAEPCRKRQKKERQKVGNPDDAITAYQDWLQTRLREFLDVLLGWLRDSKDANQREQALRTLMAFVEKQRGGASGPCFPMAQDETRDWVQGMCGGGLISDIVSALLLPRADESPETGDVLVKARQRALSIWISAFVNCYDDVRYHMLRAIRLLAMNVYADHQAQQSGRSNLSKRSVLCGMGQDPPLTVEEFADRAARLLMSFPMVEEQSDLTAFLVPPGSITGPEDVEGSADDDEDDDEMEAYDDEEDEEEEEEEEEEKQQKRLDIPAKAQSRSTTNIALRNKDLPRVMTIRYQRKVFSDAWLAVLRLPLPTVTYKKVLLWLPGNVMPHMGIPVRLADFLTDSYRLGGISSIFLLMTQHDLDYPKFFDSLLSLITPAVMQARYRARLFRIIDMCLRSTHLSTALVARFIKRLCRTVLFCPPAAGIFALTMSQKLIERNAECKALIKQSPPYEAEVLQCARRPIEALPDCVDDSDSQPALGTSLWEVQGLAHHYYAAVASLATGFTERGAGVGSSANMEQFSVLTYKSLFDQEMRRKAKSTPLAFKKPKGLMGGADGLFDCFCVCESSSE